LLPPPSSSCHNKIQNEEILELANPGEPGKISVKMQREMVMSLLEMMHFDHIG